MALTIAESEVVDRLFQDILFRFGYRPEAIQTSIAGLLNTAGSGSAAALTATNATNQVTLGAPGNVVVISSVAPVAASQTLTIPDTGGDDQFVFAGLAQTLSNKTLSAPTVTGTITLPANATLAAAAQATTNTTGFQFNPNVADGASSVAVDFNCQTTLSTTGALLFRFRNNGTMVLQGDKGGTISGGGTINSNTSGTGRFNGSVFDTLGGTIGVGNNTASGVTVGKTTTSTTIAGGMQVHRTTVADIAYTAVAGDHIIAYTSITAARVVTLPVSGTSAAPYVWVIKDESGSASGTLTITVQGASGTIDGAASKVVVNTAFGSARVYCNGTNFFTW